MLRNFIRNNVTLTAVLMFMILFSIIQLTKPGFMYNNDGSLREFGVGYRNKTILPVWLFSILLGILCYVFVLYYLTYPKFI